jgi:lipopolysaccharide biosynthesis glycosyltransferase
MASVLANTGKKIHFHVIENKLSDSNKNAILRLRARFSHGQWSFHRFQYGEKAFLTDNHLTAETYFRLFLPEILPESERVIYLDGDVVVESDIYELWNISLGSNIVGMAVNVGNNLFEDRKPLLGMRSEEPYFNAGVMLIDLKKFAEAGFPDKATNIIQDLYAKYKRNGILWYADQEVLNYLLYKKIFPLPPKFNLQSCCLLYTESLFSDEDAYSIFAWSNAFKNPMTLHFVDREKPSKITRRYMKGIFWERYYEYKALTPYADEENDRKRIAAYREYEQRAERGLLDDNAYILNNWYRLFTSLAARLPELMSGKKPVLWGAGKHCKALMAILATKDIFPALVVDGLPENRGRQVFHYTIQNPDLLKGKSSEYFVLLAMEQEKTAAVVADILRDYGFCKEGYYHVYEPIWKVLNEELI